MRAPRFLPIITVACLSTALAYAGATFAGDEEILTATPRAARALPKADESTPRTTVEAKPATQEQFIARLAAAPVASRAADTPAPAAPFGYESNGRTIHGTASVSVGTGGYRSFHVSSLLPIGESGTLGISVSQTDFGQNSPYGLGYDDGYGYGSDYGYDQPFGYGHHQGYGYGGNPWNARGGRSQSVGLSFDMSEDGRRQSGTSGDCAPGFRDGDRDVEPVWVQRARGNQSCCLLYTS